MAFASNTIYIMEKNGNSDIEIYNKILLPILKRKLEYLHAEGVAHTVWALSNAGIYDSEIWEGLKKLIPERDFDVDFVKN